MDDEMKLLLSALDNETNESIFKLSSKEIHNTKFETLSELNISNNLIIDLLNELKEYIHVYQIPDIKYGSFIKWIPLSNPEKIQLTKGGIVCDILLCDSGTVIKCKNFKNKFFLINMDKALIFRKLNNQEKILISVSNYLNS